MLQEKYSGWSRYFGAKESPCSLCYTFNSYLHACIPLLFLCCWTFLWWKSVPAVNRSSTTYLAVILEFPVAIQPLIHPAFKFVSFRWPLFGASVVMPACRNFAIAGWMVAPGIFEGLFMSPKPLPLSCHPPIVSLRAVPISLLLPIQKGQMLQKDPLKNAQIFL